MLTRLLVPVLIAAATLAPRAAGPQVDHLPVPDDGIQPQAVVDATGTLHLIYYKGAAAAGDLFYVRRDAGQMAFSAPIRVNSDPGSAIAAGAVRGGRLALGRGGWVHVAWNAAHPVDRQGRQVTPMWYARLAPGARVFEPQRAIGTHVKHLDGGGTVAADPAGHVSVVWHAAGAEDGEPHRDMLVAGSTDDGAHFAPEQVIASEGGACGCCGVSAIADGAGRLQILYRTAAGGTNRDATWMTIGARDARPTVRLQAWKLPACPMTTFAIAEGGGAMVGAWVVEQQIFTADLDPATHTASTPSAMDGSAVRNHPALAINRTGDRLFAWIEGANRSREGNVAWELRDRSGRRLETQTAAGTTPPLSLIAAVARPDGSFLLIF